MIRVLEQVHEMVLTDWRDDLRRDWRVLVFAAYALLRWNSVFLADVDKRASVHFELDKFDAREGAEGEEGPPFIVHGFVLRA